MSDEEHDDSEAEPAKTPIVLIQPPRKIRAMTDDERKAFAADIFERISAARRPSPPN